MMLIIWIVRLRGVEVDERGLTAPNMTGGQRLPPRMESDVPILSEVSQRCKEAAYKRRLE